MIGGASSQELTASATAIKPTPIKTARLDRRFRRRISAASCISRRYARQVLALGLSGTAANGYDHRTPSQPDELSTEGEPDGRRHDLRERQYGHGDRQRAERRWRIS